MGFSSPPDKCEQWVMRNSKKDEKRRGPEIRVNTQLNGRIWSSNMTDNLYLSISPVSFKTRNAIFVWKTNNINTYSLYIWYIQTYTVFPCSTCFLVSQNQVRNFECYDIWLDFLFTQIIWICHGGLDLSLWLRRTIFRENRNTKIQFWKNILANKNMKSKDESTVWGW